MVDPAEVDVVSLNVGRTIHVEAVVRVVRCQPVNLVNPETHKDYRDRDAKRPKIDQSFWHGASRLHCTCG